MAIIGQINPSPNIDIAFKTLARTAIQRSEKGIVCLILRDTKATKNGTLLRLYPMLKRLNGMNIVLSILI